MATCGSKYAMDLKVATYPRLNGYLWIGIYIMDLEVATNSMN